MPAAGLSAGSDAVLEGHSGPEQGGTIIDPVAFSIEDPEVEDGRSRTVPLSEELASIRRRCASLPVLDSRAADVILGYGPGVDPAAPIFAQDVDRG